jgi:hypothetical protein
MSTRDYHRSDYENYCPLAENTLARNKAFGRVAQLRLLCCQQPANGLLPLLLEQAEQRVPALLTTQAARKWAVDLDRFADDGIPQGLSCGASDACGEQRDLARSRALAIWRAVGRF